MYFWKIFQLQFMRLLKSEPSSSGFAFSLIFKYMEHASKKLYILIVYTNNSTYILKIKIVIKLYTIILNIFQTPMYSIYLIYI